MNKTVVRKWVEALRSGEFKQTKGRLSKLENDGTRTFCCLGVLCEIAKEDIDIEEGYDANTNVTFPEYVGEFLYNGAFTLPPSSVAHYVGDLDENWTIKLDKDVPDPRYGDDGDDPLFEAGHVVGLAELNDEGELTFEQIADALESQYLR